ncbi:MAG: right-handed parallel beta-helix repeat-containing protein [Bacteroidota bacterium]
MRRTYVLMAVVSLMALTHRVCAQSEDRRIIAADTAIRNAITVPNDLADGDLRIIPTATKQVITVGGASADVSGFTSAAIQIAVDALRQRGGGTVELKPGTYRVSAPTRLASNMSLIGAGDSTILRKVDGYRSLLAVDADYGMMKVTVQDARGFSAGMGVQLSDSRFSSDWDVTVATIVKIDHNTIFLDQATLRDYDCEHKAVLSNTCSIVEAVGVENVRIAFLMLEGNKGTNDLLGGCRGGAVYLQRATGCLIEHVNATDFNGDVFDWQITRDITVRDCEASNSTGKGFHPGTGSENSLIEGCTSHDNLYGLFLCWRVKKGTFKKNTLYSNDLDGISINKKDTDNRFEGNRVFKNGHNGVCFSDYGEPDNSHRNVFVSNVIEDNGTRGSGNGFLLDLNVKDIVIQNNTIRDTGGGTQKCGVVVKKSASNIVVRDNTMSGQSGGDIVRN